jgi:hypothetical protein
MREVKEAEEDRDLPDWFLYPEANDVNVEVEEENKDDDKAEIASAAMDAAAGMAAV